MDQATPPGDSATATEKRPAAAGADSELIRSGPNAAGPWRFACGSRTGGRERGGGAGRAVRLRERPRKGGAGRPGARKVRRARRGAWAGETHWSAWKGGEGRPAAFSVSRTSPEAQEIVLRD